MSTAEIKSMRLKEVDLDCLTPMMRQYYEIKKENDDYILFYRLGDFYEMFFEDAEIASKELEIVKTGKDCGLSARAPMCGVPYHSAQAYVARLIERGYKVAICEQTEDPAKAKGLVRREVVRKISPGTVIDSVMLDERKNNFICSLYLELIGGGLCFCDMSTGEMFGCEVDITEGLGSLFTELTRFSPREILISRDLDNREVLDFLESQPSLHIERRDDEQYRLSPAEAAVKAQFSALSFDLELTPNLTCACGALLSYLHTTQQNGLGHITTLEHYSPHEFMRLDTVARRNLEIFASLSQNTKRGSLFWVLDNTRTAFGARLLRQWLEKPLLSAKQITARQDAVEALLSLPVELGKLQGMLGDVYDIERIIGRVVYGSANAKDLRALWRVCELLPQIKAQLKAFASSYIEEIRCGIDELPDLSLMIDETIVQEPPVSVKEGELVKPGFNEELDRLRDLLTGGTGRLSAIEQYERESTGVKNLKVGYNRVFGYYIEVSRAVQFEPPEHYTRKQTLTNGERYITPELKALEGEILGASERKNALEYEIFVALREMVGREVLRVQQTAKALAALDVLCSLADTAQRYNYTKPLVSYSDKLTVKDGRHPVIERLLKGAMFVPNDTELDCGENRVYIITGPNMAGKSTYIRQVALITLMAQIGSFVPAGYAEVGICDSIFTRIGASDDMLTGRSTFMVEMNEVAEILKNATSKSLLILDEIGRGTSTFDGMAIARAVLEYVADKKKIGAKTLFATHYHELIEMEGSVSGVKNYNIVVKKRNDEIVFIKKIVRGGASDSYGIDVARLAGLPDPVISRAKKILAEIEMKAQLPLPIDEEEDGDQFSLKTLAGNEIIERLKRVQPEVLTPIEAITLLFELSQWAKEN